MTYSIQQIRRAWLDAAEAEWRRVVRDDDGGVPGDRDVITSYFEACRWGFWVPGGYVERPDNPWCGIGLGATGRRISDFLVPGQCVPVCLDMDIAYHLLPSTKRIALMRKWKAAGVPLPRVWSQNSGRFIDAMEGIGWAPEDVLLPGTVATVVTRDRYGDERDIVGGHFVMVRFYDSAKRAAYTVEFNGRGELGDGTRGEGVVHQVRKLEAFRRAYEFDLGHFEIMERSP